jgi:hypothetical protein
MSSLPNGTFYRTGIKPNYSLFQKSTLEEYQRRESLNPSVTHVQIKDDGTEWHFLQTFGLDSWAIKVTPRHRYERNMDSQKALCIFCSKPFRSPGHLGQESDSIA